MPLAGLTRADFLDITVFYEPALSVLPSFGQAKPIRKISKIPFEVVADID